MFLNLPKSIFKMQMSPPNIESTFWDWEFGGVHFSVYSNIQYYLDSAHYQQLPSNSDESTKIVYN